MAAPLRRWIRFCSLFLEHHLESHNMREIPGCLNRRYQTLDKLIKELRTRVSPGAGCSVSERSCCENNQAGIKMMCDFWSILQEDPDCNLPQEVQQRMGVPDRECSCASAPRQECCMGAKYQPRRDTANEVQHACSKNESKISKCSGNCTDDNIPLSQVLCNLKEAASFDKKCSARVAELMSAQTELKQQIQNLEEREKKGVILLKQADCMWSCMEDSYKKKVAESQERHALLVKELKEIEASANKWRKNKKDLEFQLKNINQCHEDIKEKMNQRKNDVTVMDIEIEDLKKRSASFTKDLDTAKNSYKKKRESSDGRMASIAMEMTRLQRKIAEENIIKAKKEKEGANYVKDARDDLQKICRVLLLKRLENEDIRAEKDALLQEINLLNITCKNCKEKCVNREKSIEEEIKRVETELATSRTKCIKCHQCTDTADARKCCTDCPRCLAERECLYEDDHCSRDYTMDCVCMSVKQKFLDNVFDNMYTVLERQTKTCPGKEVADCVLECLKRSRNGKLNNETRKVLQDFILSTVKKNLNLTIVSGAVKTRCEMDSETYTLLMECLQDINVASPEKDDKSTVARKAPCRRWGGSEECNCPQGPKDCVCTKKAPPPPTDPTSCGVAPPSDIEDPSKKTCTQQEKRGSGAAAWRCEPSGRPFNNMRAAQCGLGPELLAHVRPTPPILPTLPTLSMEKMITCTCGGKAVKPCPCAHRDTKHLKAEVKCDCTTATLPNFRTQTKVNHQPKLKNLQVAAADYANKQLIFDIQKDAFSDQKLNNALQDIIKNNENDTNHQFNIAIENDSGQLNSQFNALTETKSRRLAMELDEEIIKFIENKSKDDPYLFIPLRKSSSGHLLVDFDTKDNRIDNTQRVVTQTSSGTRLLDIHKNMISILKETLCNKIPNSSLAKSIKLSSSSKRDVKDINFNGTKCPVLQSKTGSGTNFVSFGDRNLNVILRKTPSEQRDFFKVKVSGVTSLPIEIPALLKTTESENYVIVLDKEFEKRYIQTIDHYIGDKCECLVDLLRTDSGNYIIELDTEGGSHSAKRNAILIKSLSGNIKVLVHGPEFESTLVSVSSKSSRSSAKAFGLMIDKLPASSIEFHRGNLRKKKIFEYRSNSDSQLCERKVKVKLQENRQLLSEPSAVMKKTNSGQYSIILNKESKKTLINTLQSYLSTNTEGLVPIKRSDSGKIIINLSHHAAKDHYGTLKITPSGNICVIVDEKVIKSMTNCCRNNEMVPKSVDNRPGHASDQIFSVNKAVATTCHARPDDCCCDASKCVCDELELETMYWSSNYQPKYVCRSLPDTDNRNAKKRGVARSNTQKDKSPLTVFKPNCELTSKNRFRSTDQCCYSLDPVCPFHQNRYDESNELLVVSGITNCKKNEFDTNSEPSNKRKGLKVWDSLKYLPPQLPSFLKSVDYRQ